MEEKKGREIHFFFVLNCAFLQNHHFNLSDENGSLIVDSSNINRRVVPNIKKNKCLVNFEFTLFSLFGTQTLRI